MRPFLLSVFMLFFAIPSNVLARKYYCEIKGIEKELASGLKIVFDFGNNPVYNPWGGLRNRQKFVDEYGHEIAFQSMVDAGNYMSERGWNFVQAYSSTYSSNSIVHWIFCKEANSPEEAVEGITTIESYRRRSK